MTFFKGLVPGEDPQPGVPLARSAAEARREKREHGGLGIAHAGNQGESRCEQASCPDEKRRRTGGSPAAQRAPDELGDAERADQPSGCPADRLVPVVDAETGSEAEPGSRKRSEEHAGASASREARDGDPAAETDADAEPDPVPVPHFGPV
jgi:hypothetical protein